MPAITKMGFEGEIYYGTAGSSASTKITNSRDIAYNIGRETGETTIRGDGSAAPIKTERTTKIVLSIEWTMTMRTTDATLTALLTAAAAGTDVAIRTKDYSSGKGFDGDCTLEAKHGAPLGGEQTYQFTATPTDADGRTPQAYA